MRRHGMEGQNRTVFGTFEQAGIFILLHRQDGGRDAVSLVLVFVPYKGIVACVSIERPLPATLY